MYGVRCMMVNDYVRCMMVAVCCMACDMRILHVDVDDNDDAAAADDG